MSFMSVTSLVLVYLLASSLAAPTPIQVYVQLGSVQEPAGYLAAMPAQYDPFGQQQIMGMGMGMTMGAMPMMEQQEVLDSYGEFCSLEGSPVALATKICCDKTNSEYKRSEQVIFFVSRFLFVISSAMLICVSGVLPRIE